MSEVKKIKTLLENSFSGIAWHGPSVMEALEGVTIEKSLRKIESSNSIVELVMHMTTWRKFVIKRLSGDTAYDVTDAENFPKPIEWHQAVEQLQESQNMLLNLLDHFPDHRLAETVAGRSYDFYTLLHGIIQHDIYHAGQIVLLKK